MSKWYGKIAYGVTKEIKPGCWSNVIETKNYYGDLLTIDGEDKPVIKLMMILTSLVP